MAWNSGITLETIHKMIDSMLKRTNAFAAINQIYLKGLISNKKKTDR